LLGALSSSLPRPTSRCSDAQPGGSANGWSLDYAKGYVDGETFRLRGKKPSNYVLIGIDEYCLGFRAGYYERQNPNLMRSDKLDTPVSVQRSTGRS
jgi:hypothetical protein